MKDKYKHNKIEAKWREIWEKSKLYETDLESGKPKFYNLIMFPYPSGDYLHIGHAYSDSGADVIGRMKRMQGFNVFMPIGYDAFGLPAENFALKKGVHPKVSTENNIKHAEGQLKSWGCMFDWSKKVNTSKPDYYKWTQWLFLKLYEQGLVYQKEAPVNWCPKCLTVLANEQVIAGFCERCDSAVEQKYLLQWYFKITDYTDRLIDDLSKIDWPESSKIKQINWIGKSEGGEINFKVVKEEIEGGKIKEKEFDIPVFTTRADTLFGATYLVLAPEHPLVLELAAEDCKKEVEKYIKKTQQKSELDRISEVKEKTGVSLGVAAVNPVNGEKIPVFISDYVLMGYGTGAIMAVPAHDQRDFEFAKKFGLKIREVISPTTQKERICAAIHEAYEGPGVLINSGEFSELSSQDAKIKIIDFLESKNLAVRVIYTRLHDWSFSRQRYWGAPIPIIYCQSCGIVPVPEKDLPVLLPNIKNFRPTGTGKGPLASDPKFLNTKCPKCGSPAKRETDTMDTFVDSSFYFIRYLGTDRDNILADPKMISKWLPVDLYIGGAEHVTMHLLYARFVAKALFDAKLINFDEPFLKLRHQGMILGPDGQKMSKSKGNVIIPDEIIKKHGSDVFRTYLLFMGPFEEGGPWNPQGLKGIEKFFSKIWDFSLNLTDLSKKDIDPAELITSSLEIKEAAVFKRVQMAAKIVTGDIENFRFNTAVAELMKCFNEFLDLSQKLPPQKAPQIWRQSFRVFTQLLSPFAPYLCEEIWQNLFGKSSIFESNWSQWDESFIAQDSFMLVIQINGKTRGIIEVPVGISQEEAEKLAMTDPKIKSYLDKIEVEKIIFIPERLINFVS